jgi:endonuclease-3 related protein
MSDNTASALIPEVYTRLLAAYGPQHWWPGATNPFEVCVGAILTQSTAWTNVEKAIAQLKAAMVLSLEGIHQTPVEELAVLVHSSGYFNVKARKLKALAQHVYDNHGGDLAAMLVQPWEALRTELLSVYGIGKETADDIVLYAANAPSFVNDAYTQRIVNRLGITPAKDDYESHRAMFMGALPADVLCFNEYHALIVKLGKDVCKKTLPRCQECPLQAICITGNRGPT